MMYLDRFSMTPIATHQQDARLGYDQEDPVLVVVVDASRVLFMHVVRHEVYRRMALVHLECDNL